MGILRGQRGVRAPKVIKIGCDFSGLCTLGTVVHRMLPQSKFKVVFGSDTLQAAHDLAQHKTIKPMHFYDDVLDRDLETTPRTDVYAWTPPCQSYSSNGKKKGLGDKRGRLVAVGVKYIVLKKPRVAVLENVKMFYSKRYAHVRKGITKALKNAGYLVHWKMLRASDFQTPQDRDRAFMVAIKKSSAKRLFSWPAPRTPKVFLSDILDDFDSATDKAGRLPSTVRGKTMVKKACDAAFAAGTNPLKVPIAIDVDCGPKYTSSGTNMAKTLTHDRGGRGGPWISSRGRRVTTTEMMKLQGFQEHEVPWKEAGVSKTVIGQMLGNAVPVPLLGCVLQEALWSAGLVVEKPLFPYTK